MIQVEASDKDPSTPQKSTVPLYINVIDENDNQPIFSPASYSPQIPEDAQPGEPVVSISAFDDDAGKHESKYLFIKIKISHFLFQMFLVHT